MGIIFSFLLVFVSFGCSAATNLPAVSNCQKKSIDGYSVAWCIDAPEGTKSQDVIYFFHGIGGSEHSWDTHPARTALRGGLLKTQPTVISISFGAQWFLSDVSFIRSSRLDVIAKDVMPLVEKSLGFEVKRRVVMGESMGGFNAIRLANREADKFDHLVAMCPAVMAFSVYWSPQKKDQYLEAHPNIDQSIILKLTAFAIYEFPPGNWDSNNPLRMIQSGELKLPPTLLSSNALDQYGFDDGIHQFDKILEQDQPGTQLVNEAGRHCVHTQALYEQIATFINL